MKLKPSTRLRIGASLLVLFAFFSGVRLLRKALLPPQTSIGIGDIALCEHRFDGIKAFLPSRGTIGYVSDVDVDKIEGSRFLLLVQYTLSPLVVLPSTKHEWIVADFQDKAAEAEVINKDHWTLVSESPGGVSLFRRKST